MQKYTVVGIYPDSEWSNGLYHASFVTTVETERPSEAAISARVWAANNRETDIDAIEIIAVFIGAQDDVYMPDVEAALLNERAA